MEMSLTNINIKQMKKIFILIIPIVIIFFTGCKKDPLDITPDGRVTLKDVFADNVQTGAYLNSCYSYIPPYGMSKYFFGLLAGYSDEAHDNDDPTENLGATDWYHGGLTPSHDPFSDWGGQGYAYDYQEWKGIYKTNTFLANIDNAAESSTSDKARWKAEAKILRAYYYWELIKMYGGMPIVDKPFTLTFDYSTLKRSPFDSCVQFILKDCADAIAEPQMPWRITTGEADRGRMTKAVAYAIESEATLFNASPLWNPGNDVTKWQQAADVSKAALAAFLSNGYALFPDYENYFISTPDVGPNPSDKETIFAKNATVGFDGSGSGMSYLNGALHAYKAGSSPSEEMVDAYNMKNGQMAVTGYSDAAHLQPIINALSGYNDQDPYTNRDPRFYASIIYNGTSYPFANRNIETFVNGKDGIRQDDRAYTHNGYYMRKFMDLTLGPNQGSGARWKVYRLAEIYLNLAEAENEANGPDQVAYDAVNAIRKRVGMPDLPNGLSKDDFRARVHNERRVELAFEEKRFWDVRRWKILDQTDKTTTGMEWIKSGGGSLSNIRITVDNRQAWDTKFLVFPIPLTEISDLPAFSQNPGW